MTDETHAHAQTERAHNAHDQDEHAQDEHAQNETEQVKHDITAAEVTG